jgi:hypothetical protein
MGDVSYMAISKSSSKITKKLNFQPILNIKLFPTHIESELGMLGIAKKLRKSNCPRLFALNSQWLDPNIQQYP